MKVFQYMICVFFLTLASCGGKDKVMCPAYQSSMSPKEKKKYEAKLLKGKIDATGNPSSNRSIFGQNDQLFGPDGPRTISRKRMKRKVKPEKK